MTRTLQVLGAASDFAPGEPFTYSQLRKALPDMTCSLTAQSVSRLVKRGLLKRIAPATYIYPADQTRIFLSTPKEREIDPVDLLPMVDCALARRSALQRAWA